MIKQHNKIMLEALKEIAKAQGRYNEDRLIHASNTIEDMVKIAKDAIAQVEWKPETPDEFTLDI